MAAIVREETDRRARRTRQAVFDAFARLAMRRRYQAIRVADLIAEAGIGRSTFYEHFRNKDAVLVSAFDPVLEPLADAAAGRGHPAYVRFTLEHLWERRAQARHLLEPAPARKLQRRLADLIEARLPPGPEAALRAIAASAAQLAMLRAWLSGEIACPVVTLAAVMARPDQAAAAFGRSSRVSSGRPSGISQ